MSQTTQTTGELRQRMIEDMRMRKLCDKTQSSYIRAVRKFAGYLGRSPDSASVEDLRNFQLHLVDHGISPITLNATIGGVQAGLLPAGTRALATVSPALSGGTCQGTSHRPVAVLR